MSRQGRVARGAGGPPHIFAGRFTAHRPLGAVAIRGGLKLRKARVLLNGRAIPVTKGSKNRRWTALIDLRRRAKGTYSVRYTVVTKSGRIVTGTRRFRTCG